MSSRSFQLNISAALVIVMHFCIRVSQNKANLIQTSISLLNLHRVVESYVIVAVNHTASCQGITTNVIVYIHSLIQYLRIYSSWVTLVEHDTLTVKSILYQKTQLPLVWL